MNTTQSDAPFELSEYATLCADERLTARTRYYAVVCNLLRTLHQLERETQAQILRVAPPLQGTPWDALLAAAAEHFAARHRLPAEPWMNEPERFLDTPWIPIAQDAYARWETALYCPAAFTRHGTLVHPSDLDSRGGDVPWKPDGCRATDFAGPSALLAP